MRAFSPPSHPLKKSGMYWHPNLRQSYFRNDIGPVRLESMTSPTYVIWQLPFNIGFAASSQTTIRFSMPLLSSKRNMESRLCRHVHSKTRTLEKPRKRSSKPAQAPPFLSHQSRG